MRVRTSRFSAGNYLFNTGILQFLHNHSSAHWITMMHIDVTHFELLQIYIFSCHNRTYGDSATGSALFSRSYLIHTLYMKLDPLEFTKLKYQISKFRQQSNILLLKVFPERILVHKYIYIYFSICWCLVIQFEFLDNQITSPKLFFSHSRDVFRDKNIILCFFLEYVHSHFIWIWMNVMILDNLIIM